MGARGCSFRFSSLLIPLVCCLSAFLDLPRPCIAQGDQSAEEKVVANLQVSEGRYVIHNFHFKSGETLPELRMHYYTLGAPLRDAQAHTTNAVLVLHGTGGRARGFLTPIFAGVLFGPGEPLDAGRYYVILVDNIGHGGSSKPSDGLRAHFPQYDYDDMVAAQHELVQKGLGVDHLRLIMGTSMGCMHTWVWGETYPGYADALMPLACATVQIAGRNRVWREMIIDSIRNDPEWKNGDYTAEPRAAIEVATDILLIAGSAPYQMQKSYPTRDAADTYLEDYRQQQKDLDANDLLYAVRASRNYNPSNGLSRITIPVLWVNSSDDFMNPPELGIAPREIQKLKRGRFVLLTDYTETHGHGTHSWAAVWEQYLKQLLAASEPRRAK
jgi:homoserine O-acetyltransferase/O-succinyltransferase